ncbi:MAG TPA: cbb3-type cytochrome c oxidase subunit II [Opitutaceae bacterium]|nr:cbb3-type cytochrome c oxidase subunit II [Opitutaceae bacterium]
MRNGAILFLGLFAALALSWAGIVVGSSDQLGRLAPYYDEGEGASFPAGFPGIAVRGEQVYRDLNCASCHTQQVRRAGYGNDEARGWGTRQSVARDYIFQPAAQLGAARIGPDLANLGQRKVDREGLLRLLYSGRGAMPAYAFLFEKERIQGQLSSHALDVSGVEPGWQVVATPRAEALVSYLLSLSSPYDYPEAKAAASAGEEKK